LSSILVHRHGNEAFQTARTAAGGSTARGEAHPACI